MPEPMPKRPWWQRKRCWAAGALLIAGYPFSVGPLMYANHRGWAPARYWGFLYAPLGAAAEGGLGNATGLYDYVHWWAALGDRHATSE